MKVFITNATEVAQELSKAFGSQQPDWRTWLPSLLVTAIYTLITWRLLIETGKQNKQTMKQYELTVDQYKQTVVQYNEGKIPNLLASVDNLDPSFIRLTNIGSYPVRIMEVKESHDVHMKVYLSDIKRDAQNRGGTYKEVLLSGESSFLVHFTGKKFAGDDTPFDIHIKFQHGPTGTQVHTLMINAMAKVLTTQTAPHYYEILSQNVISG
jgi:hypothetical protein